MDFFFTKTRKQPLMAPSFLAALEPVESGEVAGSKPQQLLTTSPGCDLAITAMLPFLRDREDVFSPLFFLEPGRKISN